LRLLRSPWYRQAWRFPASVWPGFFGEDLVPWRDVVQMKTIGRVVQFRPGTGRRRAARGAAAVMLAVAVAGAMLAGGGTAAAQAVTVSYLSQFGSQGSGPGQFVEPSDVAFDPVTGDVYVTDSDNDVVDVFDSSGNYLSQFAGPSGANGAFVPSSIAVDPGTGDLYVVDADNEQIDKFDSSGTFLLSWNGPLFGYLPYWVAVDPATGDVYVTLYDGNSVVKFDPSGNFLLTWGWGVTDGAEQLETCTASCQGGYEGTGNGEFEFPTTIAVDPSTRDVYVADTSGRVQKFDSSGDYLTQFGSLGYGSGDGQFGNNSEEIYGPTGMTVDPGTGDIYAVDGGNNRVEQVGSSGNFLLTWGWGVTDGAAQLETCTASCQAGIAGDGNGQFNQPSGDALDPATGDLYVVDGHGNDRVEVFGIGQVSTTGTTVSSSADPSVSGQQVTYTATVSPVPDQGTVAFSDNGQTIAACAAQPVNTANGTATCTVSYPGPGTHQIIASFSTGTGTGGSTSPALTQTVNQDSVTVQIGVQSTVAPGCTTIRISDCNALVTYTATVTANAPGAGTPTGSVQFSVENLVSTAVGTQGGPVQLSAGSATQGPNTLRFGAYQVTAAYSGDANFSPSTGTLVVPVPNLKLACASLLQTGLPGAYITDPAKALATAELQLAVLVAEGHGNSLEAKVLQLLIQRLKAAILIGCT
jgi:Bacterial Ig-like domain (group 3)